MTHPLDGARNKIVRAKKHFESLQDEIERYLSKKPYSVTLEEQSNSAVAISSIGHEPNEPLSCIVGDFVTNIRAALDYVAWELGTKNPTRPLTRRELRNVSFPILMGPTEFAEAYGTSLLKDVCGIPTKAFDIIESVQPYHTGYESLDFLRILVNEDKHRALLLCRGDIRGNATISMTQGDDTLVTEGPIGLGTNLQAPHVWPPEQKGIIMNMNCEASVFVTFKNVLMPRKSVEILLSDIFKCVLGIIPQFDPFF
jgi:hypothetical protein